MSDQHKCIKVTAKQYLFLAEETFKQRTDRLLSDIGEKTIKAEFRQRVTDGKLNSRVPLTDNNHEFGSKNEDGSFHYWTVSEIASKIKAAGWSPRYEDTAE